MPPKKHIVFNDDGDSIIKPAEASKGSIEPPALSKKSPKLQLKRSHSHSSNLPKPSKKSKPEEASPESKSVKELDSKSTIENIKPPSTHKPTSQANGSPIKHGNRQNLRRGKDVRFFDSEDEDDLIADSEDEPSANSRREKHHHKHKQDRAEIKKDLLKVRKSLPMYRAKDEVIERIFENDVTVLLGETGSGKSTQLPQLIYDRLQADSKTKRFKIAITQPRRVAAVNLATRVSKEMGVELGGKVGYSVRFDNKSDPVHTQIKYLTDGMLLRELMLDSNLSQYHFVILDEAHERTLLTDLSMGILKSIQEKRRGTKHPLKIIVMSATLDAERFSLFFNNANILFVEGKMYPVQRLYLTQPVEDIVDSVIQTACQVNMSEPTGDILAFLPGQDEIEKVVNRLNEIAKSLPKEAPLIVALPLYASLPSSAQQKAFEPLPKNRRKVICATNIAETSLTVPGVRYVIDSGLRKVKVFRPNLGMDTLLTAPISQSAANQRMGRAGRETAGKCFRLFTESTYMEDLPKQTEAEITRTDVSSAVLLLKRAGINDVLGFDWLESPGKRAIKSALLKLYGLKALDDSGEITDLGQKMALLPVSPQLAAVLLQASSIGGLPLLSTVIDVAACLSVEGLVMNPHPEIRDEVNEQRNKLFSGATEWGDLVMLKEMYDMYLQIPDATERKVWCKELCINNKAISNVVKVRRQIKGYMESLLGIKPVSKKKFRKHSKKSKESQNDGEEEEEELDELNTRTDGQFNIRGLIKCFLHGYIGSTAIGLPDSRYRSTINGQHLSIHPSSMMFGQKREAIMYIELVFTQKAYARQVSPIHIEWLNEIAPHLLQS